MISDAVIGLVVGLLRGLLALIPGWEPPPDAGDFGVQAGGVVGMLSGYFPITALVVAIGLIYGFRIVMTVWTALVFVYDRLPFKAT